jgi:hypothetical protein
LAVYKEQTDTHTRTHTDTQKVPNIVKD